MAFGKGIKKLNPFRWHALTYSQLTVASLMLELLKALFMRLLGADLDSYAFIIILSQLYHQAQLSCILNLTQFCVILMRKVKIHT